MKHQWPDITLNKNNIVWNTQSQNEINAVFWVGVGKS